MEHRCSIRKPVAMRVLIYKHGLPVQGGQVRDLGMGGMFIETEGDKWSRNEFLEVEFGAGGCLLRLPALVVHRRDHGIGLMFDTVTASQRQQLRALLFGRRERQAPAAGQPRQVA